MTRRPSTYQHGKQLHWDPGAQRGYGDTYQHGKQLHGTITVVQESRFRLVDRAGRGYLLTLSKHANVVPEQLAAWAARRAPLVVEFTGEPDYTSGVATRIAPAGIERG